MSDEPEVDPVEVERRIAALDDSQQRLVQHLRSLEAVDPATPSLLPDWTVAHVLSHVARNGDSMLRMLSGLPQYWKGFESRHADIELGASRPWDELVGDVESTNLAVVRCMRDVTDWSGSVRATAAERPKAMLPHFRRREVEIHRADLGLGYGFADLPGDFVREDLRLMEMAWKARQPMGLTPLPAAVLRLTDHDRLAWLFGRLDVDGVEPAGVF